MLTLTWGAWPDVLVDFGHELYVAWQLAEGRALYIDIAWLGSGPLSPQVNGALFRVFGPGLAVLAAANLVLLVALLLLLHRLLAARFDGLAALLASFLFLTVFAFSQFTGIANYNYVTPYSHAITHGLFLAVLAVTLTVSHARTGSRLVLLAAAIAAGTTALTKPEIALATFAAVGPIWLLLLRATPWPGQRLRRLALLTSGTGAPLLLAWLLLLPGRGVKAAAIDALSAWPALGASPVMGSPFYRLGLGIDAPLANLARMGRSALGYVVLLGPATLLDLGLRRHPRLEGPVATIVLVGTLLSLWLALRPADWFAGVAWPLPLFTLAALAMALPPAARAWRQRVADPGTLLALALPLFALSLLAKILLNARLSHYGFALAMPAGLLLAAGLVSTVPAALRRRGAPGTVFLAAAIGGILAVGAASVQLTALRVRAKPYVVGMGLDRFRADQRGRFVNAAVADISRRLAPAETLLVLPEGAMVNYLARRRNPSPHLLFMPNELAFHGGEGTVLADLQPVPADYVLLVYRDATEHGARLFGQDYALAIRAWVEDAYQPIALFGAPPLEDKGYGMQLLRRRDSGPSGLR